MIGDNSEAEQIRDLTRELHSAIKEARQVKRDLDAAYAAAWKKIRDDIDAKIESEVESQLGQMTDTINDHVDKFVATVDKRLSAIVDTLMGESPKQKKRGDRSLLELAEQWRADR